MDLSTLKAGRDALVGGMRVRGYSERYIAQYESMISFVLENNREEWTNLDDAFDAYAKVKESTHLLHAAKTILFGIRVFCKDGTLPGEGRRRRRSEPTCYERLGECYRQIIDAFRRAESERGAKKATTIASEASCAASFLAAMQDAGHVGLADITEESVLGFLVTDGSPTHSKTYLKSVRTVFATCARGGVRDASKVLTLIPRPLVRAMPAVGLSDDEFSSFMGVLRGDGISLRDRAIGLLLARYGLRRSDVSGLRLSDVDLAASVIQVRQQKTGVPVELPLLPEVGNALVDYVRHERPRCDNPYVFQSLGRPYGRLSPGGVYCAVARLLDRAGIERRVGGAPGDPRVPSPGRHRAPRGRIPAARGERRARPRGPEIR